MNVIKQVNDKLHMYVLEMNCIEVIRRKSYRRWKACFLVTMLLAWLVSYQLLVAKMHSDSMTESPEIISLDLRNCKSTGVMKGSRFLVTWYEIPFYIHARPNARRKTFDQCEYNNCDISTNNSNLCESDVIMFKGRSLPPILKPLNRPNGQIWIWVEDEAPITYHYGGGRWATPEYRGAFNWTVTYDKFNTDIYLPYGEFGTRTVPVDKNYLSIAKSKTKDAIIITSHCETESDRMAYILKLKEYINVDVLGACGERWDCGELWVHDDDCFSILNNTYRFYLAFEHAFCRGYRTEKLFDNFKYDILLVTRGDVSSFVSDANEPRNAYISTSDYNSVESLGRYLKHLSNSPEIYAKLLERKDRYSSVPYEEVYERALCDICKRLNFPEIYLQQITDLREWNKHNVCITPEDLGNR